MMIYTLTFVMMALLSHVNGSALAPDPSDQEQETRPKHYALGDDVVYSDPGIKARRDEIKEIRKGIKEILKKSPDDETANKRETLLKEEFDDLATYHLWEVKTIYGDGKYDIGFIEETDENKSEQPRVIHPLAAEIKKVSWKEMYPRTVHPMFLQNICVALLEFSMKRAGQGKELTDEDKTNFRINPRKIRVYKKMQKFPMTEQYGKYGCTWLKRGIWAEHQIFQEEAQDLKRLIKACGVSYKVITMMKRLCEDCSSSLEKLFNLLRSTATELPNTETQNLRKTIDLIQEKLSAEITDLSKRNTKFLQMIEMSRLEERF